MALNDLLRNASSGMRCFFKGCYKLLYMKPVIAYKTLGCPAINEFRIHPDFKYSTKSDNFLFLFFIFFILHLYCIYGIYNIYYA